METSQSQIVESVAEKRQRTERNESKMDIEGGGESRGCHFQSKEKKVHLFNRLRSVGNCRFCQGS